MVQLDGPNLITIKKNGKTTNKPTPQTKTKFNQTTTQQKYK